MVKVATSASPQHNIIPIIQHSPRIPSPKYSIITNDHRISSDDHQLLLRHPITLVISPVITSRRLWHKWLPRIAPNLSRTMRSIRRPAMPHILPHSHRNGRSRLWGIAFERSNLSSTMSSVRRPAMPHILPHSHRNGRSRLWGIAFERSNLSSTMSSVRRPAMPHILPHSHRNGRSRLWGVAFERSNHSGTVTGERASCIPHVFSV